MSGYKCGEMLGSRSGQGSASEIFKLEYELKPELISGGSDEVKDYYLRIPDDVVLTTNTLIKLGLDADKEIVKFQPLGFGLWGWGDIITYGWGPSGGYDKKLIDESCHEAWKAIFQRCNTVLLDTAEHYGYTDGHSEQLVGKFWRQEQEKDALDRSRITFATKYLPTPWRHPWKYPEVTVQAFAGSFERANLGHIDIYQLHGPSHFGIWPRLETLCEGLTRAYETGKCKAIGTCSLSFEQVKYVYNYLKKVVQMLASVLIIRRY